MAETGDVAFLTYGRPRRLHDRVDRIDDPLTDLKLRVSAVEVIVAQQSVQIAALTARMDKFDGRPERIERRLDLIEA